MPTARKAALVPPSMENSFSSRLVGFEPRCAFATQGPHSETEWVTAARHQFEHTSAQTSHAYEAPVCGATVSEVEAVGSAGSGAVGAQSHRASFVAKQGPDRGARQHRLSGQSGGGLMNHTAGLACTALFTWRSRSKGLLNFPVEELSDNSFLL